MLDVVAQNLTPAFALALSPMPLIALIVLMVAGSRASALAWTIGWFTTIFVVVGIAAAAGRNTPAGDVADDDGVNYLSFALAALLLYLSYRSFQNRPAPGMQAEEPGWISTLGGLSLPKVFGLAVVLLLLNAKNLPIYVSIGAAVAAADLSTGESVGAVAIIAFIGSLSAIVIYLVAVLGGDSAAGLLERWRVWLIQNNATVMGILFLVLGVLQLGNALQTV